MAGLFSAIETGKRALLTSQAVLRTVGQNIANVNTPGFRRQRVMIAASRPEVIAQGVLGTGVEVTDIRHARDLFLGQQEREATKSLGQWSYKEKALSELEAIFNEPQDNSMSQILTEFWDSWSELATNSDSLSNRKAVVASANRLTTEFRQLSKKMTDLRNSADAEVETIVADVNKMTGEIARLNQQISQLELGGESANDLRDERDTIIQNLAELIDVRTIDKPDGTASVLMGGMTIVDGPQAMAIATKSDRNASLVTSSLVWAGTDIRLTNLGGKLAGLIETRDDLVPSQLSDLDNLARTIVTQVNALHRSGYGMDGTTNVAFFDTTRLTAGTIQVNTEITLDPSRVAASSTITGNNDIALAMSELRDAKLMADGQASVSDYYGSMVSAAGLQAKEAATTSANYELLKQQISNARQSVEGVNLDEEMTNLVKYQHAYDASARVITAMDQALDTVIAGMGIVGRN
jgi:flagellar hook-associated protein 1 FlgK